MSDVKSVVSRPLGTTHYNLNSAEWRERNSYQRIKEANQRSLFIDVVQESLGTGLNLLRGLFIES